MKRLALALFLLCGLAQAQEKACTSTLSPGANVGAAINAASGGAVICLDDGSHTMTDSVTARPSSEVIIRSLTSARGATLSVYPDTVSNVANITFKWLVMGGHEVTDNNTTPKTSFLSYVGNSFTGPMVINMGGATGDTNILFYGNLFEPAWNTDGTGPETGMLYLTCSPQCWSAQNAGVRIEHNTFDGTASCADGIQITGGHKGVTVGPGNIFRDFVQGSCGPHVDAWQIVDGSNVTVEGNYFENNTINVGLYDGSSNVSIKNNIFNGQNSGGNQSMQIGGIAGMTFAHNTLKNIIGGIGSKSATDPNSSWVIENNVFLDVDWATASSDQDEGCGSGCIFRYNLINSSNFSIVTSPSNSVTGTISWVGGASPSTWAGWALSPGSPGTGAGNDGKDMGVLFRNPAAPTGLN